MSDFKLALVGDLRVSLSSQRREVAHGLRDGWDAVGELVKKRMRQQTVKGGLGNRLAKAWRSRTYPERKKETMNPASLVWTKAPDIVTAFSEGKPIRNVKGKGWIAVPTQLAPSSRMKGARGRRMPLDDFIEVFGKGVLRMIPKPGSGGRVLYAVATKGFRKSRGKRGGSRQVKAGGRIKAEPVLMYVLVKQVRLARVFDLKNVVRAAERMAPGIIAQKLSERIGDEL